jgi:hypothetical protein
MRKIIIIIIIFKKEKKKPELYTWFSVCSQKNIKKKDDE